MKNLPEQEEINALAALKDEYNDLAESEQFIIVVCITALINWRELLYQVDAKRRFKVFWLVLYQHFPRAQYLLISNNLKYKYWVFFW